MLISLHLLQYNMFRMPSSFVDKFFSSLKYDTYQVVTYEISVIHSLKKECIFTEQNLLIKIGITSFNKFLPTRNKFFHASIIKCSHPGGNNFIECRFSILWISEAFLLQKRYLKNENL